MFNYAFVVFLWVNVWFLLGVMTLKHLWEHQPDLSCPQESDSGLGTTLATEACGRCALGGVIGNADRKELTLL